MAGGHRAEVFPSHIEYLKPPRKKKRRMLNVQFLQKSPLLFFEGRRQHLKERKNM